MALSPADQVLVASMKQHQVDAKSRQRAADAIRYETRRFTWVVVALFGVIGAVLAVGTFEVINSTLAERPGSERLLGLDVVLGGLVGVLAGHALLRTPWGRRVVARQQARLRGKYAGDLYAGRRWQDFYYDDEEISAYIPQILYFIEGEQRFDSVADALALAKQHPVPTEPFATHAHQLFDRIAAQTTALAISSVDDAGRPTSRITSFVRSEQRGVWYVTVSPEARRVHEFDRGPIAVVTWPTEAGETISSNRVEIGRAGLTFEDVAPLYRAQVPGFVDRIPDTQEQRDLVYRLSFRSARVDTWLERAVVEFDVSTPTQG